MSTPVSIVRGTTNIFQISIKQADDTNYALQSGDILRFGITTNSEGGCVILEKEVDSTSLSSGAYLITLDPRDTANLDTNKSYWYDIGLQSGEHYYSVVRFSPITILPNVTKYKRNMS